MSLEEGAPADPHVEDSEPGQATAHALVGTLHGFVLSGCSCIDCKDNTEDYGHCEKDGAADCKLLELIAHHFDRLSVCRFP